MPLILEPMLLEEFLNLPAEEVAKILVASPSKISYIFEHTVTPESLAHVCGYCFTEELLTMLITSLQINAQLEEENDTINDDLADCVIGNLADSSASLPCGDS